MRTKFRRLITKNVLFQRSITRGLSDAGSDERIRFGRSGAFFSFSGPVNERVLETTAQIYREALHHDTSSPAGTLRPPGVVQAARPCPRISEHREARLPTSLDPKTKW